MRIGRGKDNVREFLKEYPEMADEIETKVRAALSDGDERPELKAEMASEPLSVVTDPVQKEFDEVSARGLGLLSIYEHCVKELVYQR